MLSQEYVYIPACNWPITSPPGRTTHHPGRTTHPKRTTPRKDHPPPQKDYPPPTRVVGILLECFLALGIWKQSSSIYLWVIARFYCYLNHIRYLFQKTWNLKDLVLQIIVFQSYQHLAVVGFPITITKSLIQTWSNNFANSIDYWTPQSHLWHSNMLQSSWKVFSLFIVE